MRLLIVILAALFAMAQQAGGDEPAPDNWPKTVETFANALGESDPAALLPVLSEDVSITTFDAKGGDAVRLLARTRKGAVISHLTYVHAPENMANQIAEAFKNAEVPEELKRKMALRDEAHALRANRTAVNWLTESLGAKQGDKVGVVIFWCEKAANGQPEVVFILLKGDPQSEFGKVKSICFGNPISRPGK
jgi:hypothetical protein